MNTITLRPLSAAARKAKSEKPVTTLINVSLAQTVQTCEPELQYNWLELKNILLLLLK